LTAIYILESLLVPSAEMALEMYEVAEILGLLCPFVLSPWHTSRELLSSGL
jgi:hypothetical protein